MKKLLLLLLLGLLVSCGRNVRTPVPGGMEYAQWFDLQGDRAIIHSPYGAADDTLFVDKPMSSIVCMS